MTKYCGEVKEVSGTSGGGYVAVGRSQASDNYQSISVPIGGVVSVATELPLLTIGNTTFRKIRLCLPEVAAYIHEGETICIYAFGHMLRKKIIIGVRAGNGPSWTMGFGRMLGTAFTYLAVWPFIVGIPALFAGWIIGIPFGQVGVATGVILGFLFGVGISWLSALRLFMTWREMQRE